MVFYLKYSYNYTNLKATPPSIAIEPVIFLSYLLILVEK